MSRSRGYVAAVLVALALTSCSSDEPGVDPTPERLDGSSSNEFEPDDIERANEASPEVRACCSGAVSEAQYVGCISHVDESDIP